MHGLPSGKPGFTKRVLYHIIVYGLPILTLHPPMIRIRGWSEHHRLLPRMVPLAREMGCQFIIIHAPKAVNLTAGLGRQYLEAVEVCVEELSQLSPRLSLENQAVFLGGNGNDEIGMGVGQRLLHLPLTHANAPEPALADGVGGIAKLGARVDIR